MKKAAMAVCIFFLAACSNSGNVKQRVEEAIAKAYIFERKMLPGNKLLVSYSYKSGGSVVKDSSVIDNTILPQDSIPVTLLAKNGR